MHMRHIVAAAVRSAAAAALAGILFVPTAFAQTAEAPAAAVEAPAADALPPLSTTLDAAPAIDPLTGLPVTPAIDPLTGLPVAAATPAVDPVTGLPLGEEAIAEEEAENPYSFQHMWETGDLVARSTLITLIVMSAASWYIIVTKAIEQTRMMGYARRLSNFWGAPTISEGLNRLGARNPYLLVANAADVESRPRAEGIAGRITNRRRAEIDLGRSIEAINVRLQGGMAVLATVGATAPFVGLLGTVWGIRNALIELGLSGEPSIERIAGPVGEALLMTAIGLIVAVPAVFLYNVLGRRNKKVIDTARGFAADVDALILAQAA